MFPCEIQSGMEAPCQCSHTIPIQSPVITSRTATCYINAGEGTLAMKAGFHYQIVYLPQSFTSFTLDPMTCLSNPISVFTSSAASFRSVFWIYSSHLIAPSSTITSIPAPRHPCILEAQWRRSCPCHKDRESFLELVKFVEKEVYPYNPIVVIKSLDNNGISFTPSQLDVSVHPFRLQRGPVFKHYFNQGWKSFSMSCPDR